jgi:predicted kinase
VVVDAVNDSEPARQTWRRAAQHAAVPLAFVLLVVADEQLHRRRLEGRTRAFRNIAEPTWHEVKARAATFEPWSGEVEAIDASGALDAVVALVLERLRDSQ